MKAIIIIDDYLDCFNQYQATGVMPQVSIRTIEVDIEKPLLRKGEAIHSINFKKLDNE